MEQQIQIIDFSFDWNDVKGTKFYFNEAEPLECYFLLWVMDNEDEDLINMWMIQKIHP